jgi:hypothetical protein
MEPRSQLGLMLIVLGVLLVAGGFAVMYLDKLTWLGRLPGDLNITGKGWSFHFPIVTGLILSIILTIILNLIFRR